MRKASPLEAFLKAAREDVAYAHDLETEGKLDPDTKREVYLTVNNLAQRLARDLKTTKEAS